MAFFFTHVDASGSRPKTRMAAVQFLEIPPPGGEIDAALPTQRANRMR